MKPFLLSLLFATVALADTKVVSLQKIEPVKLVRGSSANLEVTISIDPPFHIQANPASLPSMIPTTLHIASKVGVVPGRTKYPRGTPYGMRGSTVRFMTYRDSVTLTTPLTAGKTAKIGSYTLPAELKIQACNDEICFPPKRIQLDIPVEIRQ